LGTKEKINRFLEVIFTFLLFGTQSVFNAGVAISLMTLPLLPLIANYLTLTDFYSLRALKIEFWVMVIDSRFVVGRIVALIGLTVFLVAAFQWIKNHRKKAGLFKTGLYGKVRHPQFTGIIIITLGLTIMTMTWGSPLFPRYDTGVNLLVFANAGLWLVQVIGYVAIAKYEDYRLSKKFGAEHLEYKQKVPFLFPVKNPERIPELLFTIAIAFSIFLILAFLPYEDIIIFSHNLYTTPAMPEWF
jgi:protein-S-isoprenylcysteine O-methyltransferase Ste14